MLNIISIGVTEWITVILERTRGTMNKIKNIFMLLFISLFVLLQMNLNVQAKNDNKLKVDMEVGFNNNYKVGYITPIKLMINNSYKDIQGEIQIRVPSSAGKYVNYIKNLNMQKNSAKTVTINVPINLASDGTKLKYKAVITDKGKVIYNGTISTKNVSNNTTEFIGIISDDPNSMNYVNNINSSNSGFSSEKTILFNENNFPDNVTALKSVNLIIIDNFDTGKLNSNQYNALKSWIKEGGTLIIGTGNNHGKSLAAFKDNFITGTVNSVKSITTNALSKAASNGDSVREMKLDSLVMKVKDAKAVIEDKNHVLAEKLNIGNGVIGITSFALGQEPIYGWSNNSNFISALIKLINPNIDQFTNDNMNQTDYNLQEALDDFSELGNIKMRRYYLILLVYVLISAPASYLFLKKIDKREFMWLVIPVLSLSFAFIIYISGIGGRVSQITTNMITTVMINKDGNASANTYAGIVSPKKMKMRIQSRNGYELSYVMAANINNGRVSQLDNSDVEGRVYPDDNNTIEFDNVSILKTRTVKISGNHLDWGKLNMKVRSENGEIQGTVENSTILDLQDCYLITPVEYYKIGDIKFGESKQIGANKNGNQSGSLSQFSYDTLYGTSPVG